MKNTFIFVVLLKFTGLLEKKGLENSNWVLIENKCLWNELGLFTECQARSIALRYS